MTDDEPPLADPSVRSERERTADACVRSGFCPDCGASDWIDKPKNPTQMMQCRSCNASFFLEKQA